MGKLNERTLPLQIFSRLVAVFFSLGVVSIAGAQDDQPSQLAGETPAKSDAPAQPSKEDLEKALAHFSRGIELYEDKDFRSAYFEFRRAYAIAPNFRVLYNIALCETQTRDYANAVRSFEQYLLQGGSQVPESRQITVREEIAKLMQRVAFIDVLTDVQGAEVRIDDVLMGRTPLTQSLMANIGSRKVSVSRPNGLPAVQMVELASGDRRRVLLKVPNLTAKSAEDLRRLEKEQRTKQIAEQRKRNLWISGSTAGVMVVTAAILGGLAFKADKDRDDKVDEIPGDAAAVQDANDKVRALSIATDVLAISALVAGGVTLYFGLTNRPSRMGREQKADSNRANKRAVRTRLAVSPMAVQLTSSF